MDKIDPRGGYMKGNVWVVSQRANKLKSNMTLAEMKAFVVAIEKVIIPAGTFGKEGTSVPTVLATFNAT